MRPGRVNSATRKGWVSLCGWVCSLLIPALALADFQPDPGQSDTPPFSGLLTDNPAPVAPGAELLEYRTPIPGRSNWKTERTGHESVQRRFTARMRAGICALPLRVDGHRAKRDIAQAEANSPRSAPNRAPWSSDRLQLRIAV